MLLCNIHFFDSYCYEIYQNYTHIQPTARNKRRRPQSCIMHCLKNRSRILVEYFFINFHKFYQCQRSRISIFTLFERDEAPSVGAGALGEDDDLRPLAARVRSPLDLADRVLARVGVLARHEHGLRVRGEFLGGREKLKAFFMVKCT